MNNDISKEALITLSAIIRKYGEASLDDTVFTVSLSYKDYFDFDYQALEVHHDEDKQMTYYRVRKKDGR